MVKIRSKPRKSLRGILTLWFLLFSVVPLAFVTGYSLVQFETAINDELNKRLKGNSREISVVLNDLENYLVRFGKIHSTDTSLVYFLSTSSAQSARKLVANWMQNYPANRISLFDRNAKLIVALHKNALDPTKSLTNLESGNVYISDNILKKMEATNQVSLRDIGSKFGLELIVYTKVISSSGRLAGYIEENINVDENFLQGLKKRLNLEISLFDRDLNPVISTHSDFLLYHRNFFGEQLDQKREGYFEIMSRGLPFGFLLAPIATGNSEILIGLAASKKDIKNVLRGINRALFTVVGLIICLLVLTLLGASNLFLKPLKSLVEAARKIELGEIGTQVPVESETEIGLLAESFNKMSQKVSEGRVALEAKIKELEDTNKQLQDTQAQLVHSSKMVSLGQLVAGVAHELNNPIGFIYSNMSHLKDYSERLQALMDIAQTKPELLNKEKEHLEYDYIIEDMPRLIRSCEDGARRVRDIVIGLRNFSRLDEFQIKDVNIEESLQNTLSLIAGELKNRVEVKLEFQKTPAVRCYANQINQVFMNILTNAAQAIVEKGTIWISTTQKDGSVLITIRDSGKGIEKDHLDKIFDPFFTTKPVGKGTGLGLSISYGIVRKNGGTISVTSEVGQGTEFVITLPINGPSSEEFSGTTTPLEI